MSIRENDFMEKAIPSIPTSAVAVDRLIPASGASGLDVGSLAVQMGEAYRISRGIAETILSIAGDELRVCDVKRWNVAIQMLRASDHELGKAVR